MSDSEYSPPLGSPRRIQRKRTKGWRMPEGVVYVGRGSRFGNPHPVGMCPHCGIEHTREEAIAEFEAELMMDMNYQARDRVRRELAGKTLCCWCRNDQPCHADVLLRVANSVIDMTSEAK